MILRHWTAVPGWIIIGAVMVLLPLFGLSTYRGIHRERQLTTDMLVEKGAALIRAFEAGTRTGMMGWSGFQLQRLLTETAQQSDIAHIIVADVDGTVVADSMVGRIGLRYDTGLDLRLVARQQAVAWRLVAIQGGKSVFEVYRRFAPSGPSRIGGAMMRPMMPGRGLPPEMMPGGGKEQIIFVGLDMDPIEAARRADMRHSIIMGVILLMVGFAGVVLLFVTQSYRSTQTSLSRIKAFSDTLVTNMPIGLAAVDADERILTLNRSARTLLDIAEAAPTGMPAAQVLPEALARSFKAAGRDAPHAETEVHLDVTAERRLCLLVGVSPLADETGTFLGQVMLFRDVSDVKALQQEVERGRRLASVGLLASGVAHEIRNPLSSIKGFATYFKQRYQHVEQDRQTAQIMVQEVDRLDRVVGQLLELAKPMILNCKWTSVQDLADTTLKMVETRARQTGVRIQRHLQPGLARIRVDGDRLSQVLLNLYLNAIDAMAAGGELLLSIQCPCGENGPVEITVKDTGKGIDAKDITHVFDPYFTTKKGGTGLGLAIVHNIVDAHGGHVLLDSAPGRGTAVKIVLPQAVKGPAS
jgi:two-component system sensor histidine kinase HydH